MLNSGIVGIEPPDSVHISGWTRALLVKYAGLLKVSRIGSSLLGRDIYAFDIGSGRRKVLYCAGVHGREWITSLLMMYFAEELLEAYSTGGRICDIDIGRLMESVGLTVIPALNPDGIEISVKGAAGQGIIGGQSQPLLPPEIIERLGTDREYSRRWKANARGVDINRNFDSGWDDMRAIAMEKGIRGPSSEGWTGEYPASEPETRAVTALCEREQFRHLVAFHSQGEVIYWNYRNFTPARSHIMARLLAMSSGYSLGEPERCASFAGLKDWFMEKYRAPAFTVEVGSGSCPVPLSGFRFMYNRLREMLVLGIAM